MEISSCNIPGTSFTFVELFCGKGNVTGAFKEAGFSTWSLDKRKRTGVCMPDLQIDILKVTRSLLPAHKINVVWASPPCTGFSYGAGDFYFKERKPKENAKVLIKTLDKCLELIGEICPDLFFIENPRGHLRYYKTMIDWCAAHGGMIKPITLSSYNGPTTKPTDIFTNAYDWQPKSMAPFGRGAKNTGVIKNLSALTKVNQQETPKLLAEELANFSLALLLKKYPGQSVLPLNKQSFA